MRANGLCAEVYEVIASPARRWKARAVAAAGPLEVGSNVMVKSRLSWGATGSGAIGVIDMPGGAGKLQLADDERFVAQVHDAEAPGQTLTADPVCGYRSQVERTAHELLV